MHRFVLKKTVKFTLFFALFCLGPVHSIMACDDPCPSVLLGKDFEKTTMKLWSEKQTTSPLRRGVTSYHVSESEAHYIAFVSNSTTLLVSDSDCALSDVKSIFLTWTDLHDPDDEFKNFSVLEAYYQGISPILELKTARYLDGLKVYLLKTQYEGKEEQIFRIYADKDGKIDHGLGGAFAYPVNLDF